MIILKGLIALVLFLVVPLLLGFLILNFIEKEKNNSILAIVVGYLIEFAVCELLAVPMIFMQKSYNTLLCIYSLTIIILCMISIKINFRRGKEIFNESIENIKKLPKLLTIVCILLVCFQIYEFVFYTHIDDDDAFYVGTATTSIQTNSLYKYSATTGGETGEQNLLRYRLGPFSLYLAIISSIVKIHPAITAHVIMPVIFVPLVYLIYYLLGKEIFKENKDSALLFVIILSFLQIWGGYSVRTNFAFFLFRIWQGKALLANMILPAIWLLFIKADENNFDFQTCLLLFITVIAGNLTTTMGIGLIPIALMLLSLVYEISKINFKNLKENNYLLPIKNMAKCLACCMPSIVYGLIYFLY